MTVMINVVEHRQDVHTAQPGRHLPARVRGCELFRRGRRSPDPRGAIRCAGKTSLLRLLYGNYRPTAGRIEINHGGKLLDIVSATPRRVLEIRRRTLGFVSQFLRVIPRVSTLDIVRDPLLARGVGEMTATVKAGDMLSPVSTCRNAFGPWRRRPFPAASSSGSISPAALSCRHRSC